MPLQIFIAHNKLIIKEIKFTALNMGYELDNRPDWVIIPLLGILALVQVDVPQ